MSIFEKVFTPNNIIYLLQGAGMSLLVAVCALVFGTLLGILGAAGKLSRNKFCRMISSVYVEAVSYTHLAQSDRCAACEYPPGGLLFPAVPGADSPR